MNDLLFYALLAALLYYFFLYLPSQKAQPTLKPTLQNQTTQTEPTLIEHEPGPKLDPDLIDNLKKDIAQKEHTIIGLNRSYDRLDQKTSQQIKELQGQVRELVKKPTHTKSTQTDDKSLENTLDTLIKDIQDLNNSL